MAEAQQRRYRSEVLKVPSDGNWGHLLCDEAARNGRNFLTDSAHAAVLHRKEQGKGVLLSRTCGNMLSSQAMCFNLFAPLAGAAALEEKTLLLYTSAADYARTRGVIIADTKFEFGTLPDGRLILVDEVLTPDSSRFWPAEAMSRGEYAGIGKPENMVELAPLLRARATMLQELSEQVRAEEAER